MPPLEIRQLRDLMHYRFKLLNCRTSEKNLFQNSLAMSNIMITLNINNAIKFLEQQSYDVKTVQLLYLVESLLFGYHQFNIVSNKRLYQYIYAYFLKPFSYIIFQTSILFI